MGQRGFWEEQQRASKLNRRSQLWKDYPSRFHGSRFSSPMRWFIDKSLKAMLPATGLIHLSYSRCWLCSSFLISVTKNSKSRCMTGDLLSSSLALAWSRISQMPRLSHFLRAASQGRGHRRTLPAIWRISSRTGAWSPWRTDDWRNLGSLPKATQ